MNFQQYYWLIMPLAIVDIIGKGFSLWFAARENQRYWFIALLLINSLGLLPLIYLGFFATAPEVVKLKKRIFKKKK